MPSVQMKPRPTSPCPTADVLELVALGRGSTDEVRFHVDACDSCRAMVDEMRTNEAFLDEMRPAFGSGSGSGLGSRNGSGDAYVHTAATTGEIPGYTNLAEISRGGQGIVYRAIHSVTKRKVAIKMLLRGAYASPRELHRFEREIEIVASMRHPNIVTVFDSGSTTDGRHYVVMEYIHGMALDRHIKEKLAVASKRTRWLYEPHTRLFGKIAAAVQHAHSRGVIHRDLKPGNILIDDAGEPHIVDFGMARALSMGRGPMPTLTREFGGTLAYASPEQVGGDPERIDVRTDVYSLGVIFYEMLTGSHPYPVSGPISEVVKHIESTEPKRPSLIEPTIGGEVETIILKALAKEPERRYQSAGEMARDVEDFLAGRPISARSDSAWYLMTKMARRHRSAVIAGCLMATVVGGSAVAAYVSDRHAVRAAGERDGVRESITRVLGAMDIAKGSQTPRDRFLGILDAGEREIDSAFNGFPAEELSVRQSVGYGYREIGETDKAEAQYKRALELAEQDHASAAKIGALRLQLAQICAETPAMRFDDAKRYLSDDAVKSVRESGDRALLSDVLRSRAQIELMTNPQAAAGYLEEASALVKAMGEAGADARDVAERSLAVDDALAAAYFARQDFAKAKSTYESVYARLRTKFGDRHIDVAAARDCVGDCQLALGENEQALATYLAVHEVYEALLIRPDIRLINSFNQLGATYKALGRTVDASKATEQAGAMKRELEAGRSRK